MNTNAKGAKFERQTKALLEAEGYYVTRASGSLGDADLVALRLGDAPLLVEVKATKGGPYETFGPADRKRLRSVAAGAGGAAVLFWWPGGRRGVERIEATEWPGAV